MTETAAPQSDRGRTRRWTTSLAAGLAVALLLLGAMELLAAFLPLESAERRFIDRSQPYFTPGEGALKGRYRTDPSYQGVMNFQTFARRKPAGVTRVFFLGGSAALGWPSSDECAFTGTLRRALDAAAPGRFELVNAAAMSFGSHRVLEVLSEVVKLEPDLVVIWCGNNEYVERNSLAPGALGGRLRAVNRLFLRSHLYRALRVLVFKLAPSLPRRSAGSDLTDQRQLPRVQRGTLGRLPEIDRQVLENYRRNLAAMAELLRERGVRGVLCTVPVNLSGWAPFTVPPHFRDQGEARAWRTLMDEGVGLLDRRDDRQAADRFARVAELAPRDALAAFFQGQARQRLGEYPRAYELFSRARDDDARPLRALSPFNEAVRTLVSSRGDLTLVDLEQDFRDASGPGLVGTDLFVDYCHPNPAGHRVAARSLARVLPGAEPDSRAAAALEAAIARDSCPPQDADHLAVAAYALGMTSQNNGLDQPAEQAYREALRHRPAFPEAESNLGVLLRKRGAAAEAEDHFRRALRIDPEDSVALFQLAATALEQARLDEAAAFTRRVLSGNAQNPQARELLGDIAARKGSWAGALADYQEAASQGGESRELRVKLGEAYHALGREREAAREWSLALELRPDDERTRALLERSRRAAGGGASSGPPRPAPPAASPERSP